MRFATYSANALVLDVGSSRTVLASARREALVREPSRVACVFRKALLARNDAPSAGQGQLVAVGAEADTVRSGVGTAVRIFVPVVDGRLVDPEAMELMVRTLARKLGQPTWRTRLLGGTLGVLMPVDADEREQAAYLDQLRELGLGKARAIPAAFAAARGCGLDIARPEGQMLIDIGGGKLCVYTFALGGLAAWSCSPIGGAALDRAVMRHVEERYRLRLSRRTAERIKCAVGSVYPKQRPETLEVIGAEVTTGIEKKVTLDDNEIRDVLIDGCEPVVMAIHQGFEAVPPELAGDVARSGVTLLGGGALLEGLPAFLAERTGLAFRLAPDPVNAAIRGARQFLQRVA